MTHRGRGLLRRVQCLQGMGSRVSEQCCPSGTVSGNKTTGIVTQRLYSLALQSLAVSSQRLFLSPGGPREPQRLQLSRHAKLVLPHPEHCGAEERARGGNGASDFLLSSTNAAVTQRSQCTPTFQSPGLLCRGGGGPAGACVRWGQLSIGKTKSEERARQVESPPPPRRTTACNAKSGARVMRAAV